MKSIGGVFSPAHLRAFNMHIAQAARFAQSGAAACFWGMPAVLTRVLEAALVSLTGLVSLP